MRDETERQETMMMALTPDGFVPKDHPLWRIKPLFDELYADNGRPSIPPEQLRYNLLFKWFLDLNVEDEPFHPTTFTKNRERLLDADAARVFAQGSGARGATAPAALSGPLHGGRHAAGGLGLAQ